MAMEGIAPRKKKEKLTPEMEVSNFVSEFGLEASALTLLEGLSDAQKLKITYDLKRRIVDVVQADAQTQYSEHLKEKTGGKVGAAIRGALYKGMDMQEVERNILKELKETPEGQAFIKGEFALLAKIAATQDIEIIDVEGEKVLTINYLNSDFIESPTNVEQKAMREFNLAANKFRAMPYEWGQEDKGMFASKKSKYEKAEKEYKLAREEILKIKKGKEKPEEEGQAIFEVSQIDGQIQMEQLLGTHPEFESALDKMSEDPSTMEWATRALKNKTTGTGLQNLALSAGGAGLRIAAKGAALASSATIVTAVAAPVIGATVGAIRGRMRGKETLKQRKQDARHGHQDKSKERFATTDATHLTKRLTEMTDEVEKLFLSSEDDSPEVMTQKIKRLAMLSVRIEHTQGKVEKGEVNFGDVKTSTVNQYDLLNVLNKALVLKEVMSAKVDREVKKNIDGLLATVVKESKENIDSRLTSVAKGFKENRENAKDKFLMKQMGKGALIGAGAATIGYGVRWLGEHYGWWGGHNPDTNTNPEGHGKLMSNPDEQSVPDPVDTKINVAPPRRIHLEDAPDNTPGGEGSLDKTIKSGDKVENINPYAVVHEADEKTGLGGGITYSYLQQLKADPALCEKLGIDHDRLSNSSYAGKVTAELAVKTGYMEKVVDADGSVSWKEIQVLKPEKVAYVLKVEGGEPVTTEFEVTKNTDGTYTGIQGETNEAGSKFEATTDDGIEKDYETYDGKEHNYYRPHHTTPRDNGFGDGTEGDGNDDNQTLESNPNSKIDKAVAKIDKGYYYDEKNNKLHWKSKDEDMVITNMTVTYDNIPKLNSIGIFLNQKTGDFEYLGEDKSNWPSQPDIYTTRSVLDAPNWKKFSTMKVSDLMDKFDNAKTYGELTEEEIKIAGLIRSVYLKVGLLENLDPKLKADLDLAFERGNIAKFLAKAEDILENHTDDNNSASSDFTENASTKLPGSQMDKAVAKIDKGYYYDEKTRELHYKYAHNTAHHQKGDDLVITSKNIDAHKKAALEELGFHPDKNGIYKYDSEYIKPKPETIKASSRDNSGYRHEQGSKTRIPSEEVVVVDHRPRNINGELLDLNYGMLPPGELTWAELRGFSREDMPPAYRVIYDTHSPEQWRVLKANINKIGSKRIDVWDKLADDVQKETRWKDVYRIEHVALTAEEMMHNDLNKIFGTKDYLSNGLWKSLKGENAEEFIKKYAGESGDKGQLARYMQNIKNTSDVRFKNRNIEEFLRNGHVELAIKFDKHKFEYDNLVVPGEEAPALTEANEKVWDKEQGFQTAELNKISDIVKQNRDRIFPDYKDLRTRLEHGTISTREGQILETYNRALKAPAATVIAMDPDSPETPEAMRPLAAYADKLHKATGLEPKDGEKFSVYEERAMKAYIAKHGNLKGITLTDKEMEKYGTKVEASSTGKTLKDRLPAKNQK